MSAHDVPRIALLHGPNLGMLGRRPSGHYGQFSLFELEQQVRAWAAERGMRVGCFQTDHEGAFLEHVHGLSGLVDGAIVNPGAWTHYQWSTATRSSHSARRSWRSTSQTWRPAVRPSRIGVSRSCATSR